jgi:hypothetical protein
VLKRAGIAVVAEPDFKEIFGRVVANLQSAETRFLAGHVQPSLVSNEETAERGEQFARQSITPDVIEGYTYAFVSKINEIISPPRLIYRASLY